MQHCILIELAQLLQLCLYNETLSLQYSENSFSSNKCITYPDLASPCISLTLRGPQRFLESAVGTIGTAFIGANLNRVATVIRSNSMCKMKFWLLPWQLQQLCIEINCDKSILFLLQHLWCNAWKQAQNINNS